MSDNRHDGKPIGIRCLKCGRLHERPIGWVRANSVMQCDGCGVTIRLDQKRLPAPPVPTRWWRNPRYRQFAALWPFVVLIAIFAYGYISDRKPPSPVPARSATPATTEAETEAAAKAAADAWATSPPAPASVRVPAPAPAPVCESQPDNGFVMTYGERGRPNGNRSIRIVNGAEGNAIVGVRDMGSGKTVVSFFVASNSRASFDRLPAATYRIQWIFGGLLGADCSTFATPTSAGEFDQPQDMRPYDWVSLTLFAVHNGNASSHAISFEQFYAK